MVFRLAVFALAAAFGGTAEPFDMSKLDPEAIAQLRQAWQLSERGNSNQEVVVLIVQEPDGGYKAEVQVDPHGYQTVTFQWNPRAVAIFHTHPNRSPARPSPQDMSNSDRFQVPNFTLTSRGMYVYDPATRETFVVMPFLSWLRVKNWQRGKMLWPRRQRASGRTGQAGRP